MSIRSNFLAAQHYIPLGQVSQRRLRTRPSKYDDKPALPPAPDAPKRRRPYRPIMARNAKIVSCRGCRDYHIGIIPAESTGWEVDRAHLDQSLCPTCRNKP